ncbi:hypothetical protein [Streptomyces sp. NBC_00696]|uniref:hypothetical protein n=1 Tax=Streptomyces sp. NBC_00696 TaxID=2903672 RepID=UPI002E32BA5D|nr:hypothetical protein [Streptomyces sp. NBC_00696]
MTKSGKNARKQAARRAAEAHGIPYAEALRRVAAAPHTSQASPEHADLPCPPDCIEPRRIDDQVPPWEQPSCPIHQPDAHAGWYLEGAYPLARLEFLTKGDGESSVHGLELSDDSVTTVAELAAFRSRLSAAAKRDFDRDWELLYDSEASGVELILMLRQADEHALHARALAQEREAIRREFRVTVGVDETEYDEFVDKRGPVSPDHAEEIEHLTEVIDTATALLAMLLNHTNTTHRTMEQGPFAALLAQRQPATADEVYQAAGWELTETAE